MDWATPDIAKPTNVPKNIWGSTNIKAMPVAAPSVFAIVAVIKPNPTLHKEKIRHITKAKTMPGMLACEWKPMRYAVAKTIMAWSRAVSMFESAWLSMNSVDVVGVTLILLSSPLCLILVKELDTIIIKNIEEKAKRPGAI